MKKRLILVISLLMVFAFTAGVVANPAVQTITANLAADFKFVVNGESWQPTDADGSNLVPIVYNGRTYLPARAIGEALDVKVDWDDATRTVILGDTPAPVEEPVVEEPVVEEPVVEEPVVEEPVVEEPVADTAIAPVAGEINKNAPADGSFVITWGDATKVTEVLAGAPAFGLNFDPKEGDHYVVTDNGDGTANFVIKKELAGLLPVPIAVVPDGAELVMTIQFDNGKEFSYTYKVVS